MREQKTEEIQISLQPIERTLKTRQIIIQNIKTPIKTLILGVILSLVSALIFPDSSLACIAIVMPIFILSAITQLSLSLVKELIYAQRKCSL
jgi:hypothetical protein